MSQPSGTHGNDKQARGLFFLDQGYQPGRCCPGGQKILTCGPGKLLLHHQGHLVNPIVTWESQHEPGGRFVLSSLGRSLVST